MDADTLTYVLRGGHIDTTGAIDDRERNRAPGKKSHRGGGMMRTGLAAALGSLVLALSVSQSHGVDLPPPQGPYPVELQVGEILKICLTGKILCPAIAPICDDPTVAMPVDTPDGIGFKGIGPGTTVCGAQGRLGSTGRPAWRITVRAPSNEAPK